MNEDFDTRLVKTWKRAAKEGHQKKWIADELRVTYSLVKSRAEYLREAGIDLPHLTRGNIKIHADKVKELKQLLHNEGTSDHPDVTGEN